MTFQKFQDQDEKCIVYEQVFPPSRAEQERNATMEAEERERTIWNARVGEPLAPILAEAHSLLASVIDKASELEPLTQDTGDPTGSARQLRYKTQALSILLNRCRLEIERLQADIDSSKARAAALPPEKSSWRGRKRVS